MKAKLVITTSNYMNILDYRWRLELDSFLIESRGECAYKSNAKRAAVKVANKFGIEITEYIVR